MSENNKNSWLYMKNDILGPGGSTLTDADLARLEELAGKATPGPWADTETVFDLFGVYPDDWWQIYAGNTDSERRSYRPAIKVCCMSSRATDDEINAARKVSWEDETKRYDPGQAGHDARYIAAACNAAPALVAEVRRLRAELEQTQHGMEAAYMSGRADGRKEAEAENAALRDRVEALEKAKDHLSETARVLAEQVGKGNLGKIQDALNYAHYKASEREAIR